MREEYRKKIEKLKEEQECYVSQFNYISGIDIHNKVLDSIIMKLNAIDMMLDSIYIQAKANKIALN